MQKNKNRKIKISTYDSNLGKPDFSVKVNWDMLADEPNSGVDGGRDEVDMSRQIMEAPENEELDMVDFDYDSADEDVNAAKKLTPLGRMKLGQAALKDLSGNANDLKAEVQKDTSRDEPMHSMMMNQQQQTHAGSSMNQQMQMDQRMSMNQGTSMDQALRMERAESVRQVEPMWRDESMREDESILRDGRNLQGRQMMAETQKSEDEPVQAVDFEYNPFKNLTDSENSMEENTMTKQTIENQAMQKKARGAKRLERWFMERDLEPAAEVEVKDDSDAVLEEYFADQDAMAEFDAAKDLMMQSKQKDGQEDDNLDNLSLDNLFDEGEPEQKTLAEVDAVMAERIDKLEMQTGIKFDYLRDLLANDQESCATARQQDDATLIKIANTYNVMNMGSMLAKNMLSQDPNSVAAFHDNIMSALATYGSSM